MTSLVTWVGVDSRGPASVYLASDSRISWNPPTVPPTIGQKVFSCANAPDIFGFCGDVAFPSRFLRKLCAQIDAGDLLDETDEPSEKHDLVRALALEERAAAGAGPSEFSILHVTRRGEGMASSFHFMQLDFTRSGEVNEQSRDVPSESGIVASLGSGGAGAKMVVQDWNGAMHVRTSRAVFSAFCDHIGAGSDPYTGGPPQLVALRRTNPSKECAVVYQSGLFRRGLPVTADQLPPGVACFNELFELCDPRSLRPLQGAQRHARPRGR